MQDGRSLFTGVLHSAGKECGSDTDTPMRGANDAASHPPASFIVWDQPLQGAIAHDASEHVARNDTAPASRLVVDVGEDTWRCRSVLDLQA